MSHSMYTYMLYFFSGNVMSSPELVFEGVTFVLSFLIIQFLGKKREKKLRQQKQLCRLWWKDTHSLYYYTIIKSILVLNKIKSCQEIPNTNLSRKKVHTLILFHWTQFSLSNLLQDLFQFLDFCPALHFFLDRLYSIYTCNLLNVLVCSFFKSYIVQIILRQVTQLLILLYFYDLFVSFIFQ